MSPSLKKLAAWVEDIGSQTSAARVIGCSVPYLNQILHQKKKPSRRLARDIYLRTRRWRRGPIEMSGWEG